MLKNKSNITDHIELSKVEEKLSKQKAKQLFDSGDINQVKIDTFEGLAYVHKYLFEDIKVLFISLSYRYSGFIQSRLGLN